MGREQKEETRKTMSSKDVTKTKKSLRTALPAVILLAGIIMMFFGIWRGELQMILQKAILVCLECIGIG